MNPVSRLTIPAVLVVLATLSACGPAPVGEAISDPHEAQNRAMHEFNVSLDKNLIRPASGAYGGGLPRPVRTGVANFSQNIDTPRRVVNDILQARFADAAHNVWRFAINTTIGIGGLFDPATAMGLDERDTDFGVTLYVWGVPEGDYQELPALGPSTDRDTIGWFADLALNPLTYVLPIGFDYAGPSAYILSKLGDRYDYQATLDSILYDSADGYAQTRILYLENRRHDLRRAAGTAGESEYFDPYGDSGDAGAGAASSSSGDEYLDPYASYEDLTPPDDEAKK